MNVTVPGPENCTSPSLCWFDGNNTITLKNVSETYNIKKCRKSSIKWEYFLLHWRKKNCIKHQNKHLYSLAQKVSYQVHSISSQQCLYTSSSSIFLIRIDANKHVFSCSRKRRTITKYRRNAVHLFLFTRYH